MCGAKVLEINMGDTHKQLHKLWTLEANGSIRWHERIPKNFLDFELEIFNVKISRKI